MPSNNLKKNVVKRKKKEYFALSIKAMSPEAIAAAAELAPKSPVQALLVSAVICK